MIRLTNRTKHVLMIDRNTSISPRGSIDIRNDQLTDHIKQLERNGLIDIKFLDAKKTEAPEVVPVIIETSQTKNVSRKTSNKKKAK